MPPIPITSSPALPGPDPADLLDFLCTRTASDITLLHASNACSNSILALNPYMTLEVDSAGRGYLQTDSAEGEFDPADHPFQILQGAVEQFPFEGPAPHPLVGWLGFISYDIAHTLEKITPHAQDELHWPLLHFTLFKNYFLHDPSTRTWTAISLGNDPYPMQQTLAAALHHTPSTPPASPAKIITAPDESAFLANVQTAKNYIAAGDIYQANIAQRWIIPTNDPPHEIYRRLCHASPAPYAAFARFTSIDGTPRHILSASPELFLSLDQNRQLITRPIKGTRPRDLKNSIHDVALKEELLASEKEKAELAMIVDLLRNDLGKVSDFGSVNVITPREIEPHPTVWHTAATITSTLRKNASLADLLTALCPGGSITGAPKIRAMQIIEELEPTRRNLYCGNIGVIAPQAASITPTLTLNIAIRTIQLQDHRAHLHAGSGIVADSEPLHEHYESLSKAAALLRALGVPAT